ncbi:MAG: O-methyltransferase [Clostridia bacterium]|nr:O-methyltransferase [Clostridia bacterium]
MENITEENVTTYINKTIKKNNPFLCELEKEARAEHIPVVHNEAGRFLAVLLSIIKPKKILEIGTAIGYSAILMHEACGGNVKITTIERDAEMIERAKKNLHTAGILKDVTILEGDAQDKIKEAEGDFDFVFIDAAKGQYMKFFEEVSKKVRPGSVIVTDNVLFMGKVAIPGLPPRKHRTIVVNLREYLDMLCTRDDLDTSILPLGDGMAITRIK